ncbi:MAG: hypothetical protein JSR60_14250 [Proteobacteria bacterium]|nr:hypothetical protein [Pseudomonadota bacterium]
MTISKVGEELAGATAHGPNWQATPDRLLLEIPGLCRVMISSGREVSCVSADGEALRHLPAFMSSTILAALLRQRGRLVLRASAIASGGKAILFCGASGSGKSTLAAALAAHGLRVLGDDICVLDGDRPSELEVHGDGSRPRLWRDALLGLGVASRQGPPLRPGLEKFHTTIGDGVPASPLPLGAIYLLRRPGAATAPDIVAAAPIEAVRAAVAGAYLPSLPVADSSDLRVAAALASHGDVYHLGHTHEFSSLTQAIAQLSAHWSTIGLGDGLS